jgi:hypothetical protein
MVSFGLFCAVLLILLGVLLLLERTVGAAPPYVPGYVPPVPTGYESAGRASFVSAANEPTTAPSSEPGQHEGEGR